MEFPPPGLRVEELSCNRQDQALVVHWIWAGGSVLGNDMGKQGTTKARQCIVQASA